MQLFTIHPKTIWMYSMAETIKLDTIKKEKPIKIQTIILTKCSEQITSPLKNVRWHYLYLF
jgi:hypothetical protein